MPIALAPFDASRDFVAKARFRAGGRIWLRDQPFDKSFVNERVLGQLYNQRMVDYSGPPVAPPKGKPPHPAKHVARLAKALVAAVVEHMSASQIDEGPSGAQPPAIDGVEGGLTNGPDQNGSSAAPEATSTLSTGAPGTTREVPGAEESTSAQSGTASAPQTTEPDAQVEAPDEEEAAAAPDGDAATAAASSKADRDAAIERLMIDHSHGQLLEKATDLPAVNKRTPKADVAAAIVDAGLAG